VVVVVEITLVRLVGVAPVLAPTAALAETYLHQQRPQIQDQARVEQATAQTDNQALADLDL
jgi:hypothetical protein